MTGFPSSFARNNDFILEKIEDSIKQKMYRFDSGVVLDNAIVVVAFDDSDDNDTKKMIDELITTSGDTDHSGALCFDSDGIICSFYPVKYCSKDDKDQKWVKARLQYVYDLFDLWGRAGFNRKNAKDPFKSKLFCEFIENIFKQEDAEYVEIAVLKGIYDGRSDT